MLMKCSHSFMYPFSPKKESSQPPKFLLTIFIFIKLEFIYSKASEVHERACWEMQA